MTRRRREAKEAGGRNCHPAGRRHRRGGVAAATCLAAALLSGKAGCFTVPLGGAARPGRIKVGTRGVPSPTRTRTGPLPGTSPDPSTGGDDFSDFYGGDQEDDGAADLASEFYREMKARGALGVDETSPGSPGSESDGDEESAGMVLLRSASSPPIFGPGPFVLPDLPEIDLLSLLSDLFPPPSPAAPSASAGLFSGRGSTVVSPGRASLAVDVEMLERAASLRAPNNGTGDGAWWWDSPPGSPEGTDERRARLVGLAVASLVLLSALYAAHEASPPSSPSSDGVLVLERAAEAADRVLRGATVRVRDGSDPLGGAATSLVVTAGRGEVLLAREAAWLARETAHLGSSVAAAVRQVEELVVP